MERQRKVQEECKCICMCFRNLAAPGAGGSESCSFGAAPASSGTIWGPVTQEGDFPRPGAMQLPAGWGFTYQRSSFKKKEKKMLLFK